ncbi:hypothetical protein [Candidatus Neptunichlamydia sp. REUL1]|uniref:hypothetical protein n=1 Tax=Candidatus Neptunichlamydia sp. REUL1 TaxID=3064277 RepID=UPI0029300372|nr:hypothetical protein [Candidatus Neptunochlamydia sp. REUL1]
MKKVLGSLLLVLGMSTACAQYGSYSSTGSSNNSYDSYSQYGQQGQQQTQQMPQQQSTIPSDCSHLSQQEQQFAMQLSDMHRTMFCRHFSVSQRIEAMTLANAGATRGASGQPQISPDAAVEVIMKNARKDQSSDVQQQPSQSPYGGSYSYPGNSGSSSSKSPYSN